VRVLFLLFLAACAKPQAEPTPKNIIFILVDTLRADHLGVYGYERATSPNVDAFAAESLLFKDTRSQASCTFPSANSILTSRSPSAFLGQANQALGIPPGIPSLAEILQARGYRTVAVSSSAVVRKTPSRHNPSAGFGRGFDTFLEDCIWKSAACVNQQTFPELRRGDKPLFLYLHYLDPHGPYSPPKAFRRKFATLYPDKEFIRKGDPNPIGEMIYKGGPDPGATPADLQHLIDLYDSEIAYFDSRFALLLEAIRKAGLFDDSILVFLSDHGEEFLEHGHIKHCRTVFDSSIRTPLILRIPGVEPRALSTPVENIDVVPTLLDYLGIEAGLPFEGKSLRPLIEGAGEAAKPGEARQFAMQGTLRSAADGHFKLIHDLAAGTFTLYDLQADPGEKTDTLVRHRRAFFALRKGLTAWLERTEPQSAGESIRQATEAEKKLRALGYLE
jgi:arylsulfatase A-like enzyme